MFPGEPGVWPNDRPEMQVTMEEMIAHGIKPTHRDYCAHVLIPLVECRRANFPLPWKCEHERDEYRLCQAKETVRRMKWREVDREQRKQKEQQQQQQQQKQPLIMKQLLPQQTEPKKKLCVGLRSFSLSYWLWVSIAVTIYGTIFPFLGNASQYIAEKWSIPQEEATMWLSFIDLTSLFMSPIFGWTVDFTAKRGYLVIIGNMLAVFGYLLLGLSRAYPLVAICFLGMHFSLMPAALWPCLPSLVIEEHTGFAFAIVSSLINAFLTAINPLAGYIVDNFGFDWLMLFFAAISCVSLLLAIVWNLLDFWKDKPQLNLHSTK